MTQSARIVSAWLHGIRVDVIAFDEKIPLAEVQRIIERTCKVGERGEAVLIRSINAAEADIAYETWGANCGPGAIAAIMNMPLDEVRPLMGDFEKKHYTNPTLMWEVLDRIGRPWRKAGKQWPVFGLARIQWEGPWTAPGVPPRVAYRMTHWVASWKHDTRGHGVFDINMRGNGTGWAKFSDWEKEIVPAIVAHIPRANGKWHVTHGVEVDP